MKKSLFWLAKINLNFRYKKSNGFKNIEYYFIAKWFHICIKLWSMILYVYNYNIHCILSKYFVQPINFIGNPKIIYINCKIEKNIYFLENTYINDYFKYMNSDSLLND